MASAYSSSTSSTTAPTPINGPLTVIDDYPAGAPASSDFEPTPPWACVPDRRRSVPLRPSGRHAGRREPCTPITVKAVVRTGLSAPTTIRNCAEVQPIPGETDLTNNKACAECAFPHRQPGQPALRITKTCDGALPVRPVHLPHHRHQSSALPRLQGRCGSTTPPNVIGAGTPVQIQTVTPDGAEWTCGPVPADTLSCQIPGAVMTPGTSRHFDVTLTVSPNQRFENCARGSYGPAPGDDIVYPFGEACDQGGADRSRSRRRAMMNAGRASPAPSRSRSPMTATSRFTGPVRIGDAIERRRHRTAGRRADHVDRSALRLLARTGDPADLLRRQPVARRRGEPRAPA